MREEENEGVKGEGNERVVTTVQSALLNSVPLSGEGKVIHGSHCKQVLEEIVDNFSLVMEPFSLIITSWQCKEWDLQELPMFFSVALKMHLRNLMVELRESRGGLFINAFTGSFHIAVQMTANESIHSDPKSTDLGVN